MQAQLRERFAGGELEVVRDVVGFLRRGIILGRGCDGAGQGEEKED